jgi:hypothetical protein
VLTVQSVYKTAEELKIYDKKKWENQYIKIFLCIVGCLNLFATKLSYLKLTLWAILAKPDHSTIIRQENDERQALSIDIDPGGD